MPYPGFKQPPRTPRPPRKPRPQRNTTCNVGLVWDEISDMFKAYDLNAVAMLCIKKDGLITLKNDDREIEIKNWNDLQAFIAEELLKR